jgi:SAM-dependent methyltransferase
MGQSQSVPRISGVGLSEAPAGAAPPCPLCEGGARRLFRSAGHWICECTHCAHRYADVRRTPDHVDRHYGDDYFFAGGAGFPNYLDDADVLRRHGRQYSRILRTHCPPGRVLDVGAAAGFLLDGFVEEGWTATAIEPNDTMAHCLRERLGCRVYTQPLETFQADEGVDLVMMIQVVAHFFDPPAAFAAAARATRPGGFWLIEAWDRASSMARLFGRHWHEYSPPTVLHWFTRDSLAALAARFGFHAVDGGRARKRISAAHAKSLLRYRLPHVAGIDKLLGVVPDRWALPYPGDDLFWVLLRRKTTHS